MALSRGSAGELRLRCTNSVDNVSEKNRRAAGPKTIASALAHAWSVEDEYSHAIGRGADISCSASPIQRLASFGLAVPLDARCVLDRDADPALGPVPHFGSGLHCVLWRTSRPDQAARLG